MEVMNWPCKDCGKEHFVFLTAMFLSLIHRSSHSRLQSHSRYGVWKSLRGRRSVPSKADHRGPLRPFISLVCTAGDLQRLQ